MTDPFARFWTPIPSRVSQAAAGRDLRAAVPRRSLADLTPGDRDPLGILQRQNRDRVPDLIGLRAERMAASPFAFYRGTAALMAADLRDSPHTGILVGSCGDAHVANFGFYASPQRTLVFDLNDFDEAALAPWEWDVKRLVTSIVIAGQATARDDAVVRAAALSAVTTYARALRAGSRLSALERYYVHIDLEGSRRQLDRDSRSVLRAAIRDARKRTGDRAVRRLTTRTDEGRLVFVESPPTMTHVDPEVAASVHRLFQEYARSVNVDIAVLLRQYAISDLARRVVGVGSVGTRCYVVVSEDGDGNALLLQTKQAGRSVLEEYGGIAQPDDLRAIIAQSGEGARVITLQRVLQAVSDPFLGHLRNEEAGGRDFYVRQFHDMKGGLDIETLDDEPFRTYAEACALILARAHSQSVRSATAAGYIGRSGAVAEAIVQWAYAYADLSRADYDAFVAAGSVPGGAGSVPGAAGSVPGAAG